MHYSTSGTLRAQNAMSLRICELQNNTISDNTRWRWDVSHKDRGCTTDLLQVCFDCLESIDFFRRTMRYCKDGLLQGEKVTLFLFVGSIVYIRDVKIVVNSKYLRTQLLTTLGVLRFLKKIGSHEAARGWDESGCIVRTPHTIVDANVNSLIAWETRPPEFVQFWIRGCCISRYVISVDQFSILYLPSSGLQTCILISVDQFTILYLLSSDLQTCTLISVDQFTILYLPSSGLQTCILINTLP
jgi:hypothetical protein